MFEDKLESFINKYCKKTDKLSNYKKIDNQLQLILEKIYMGLYRFNLRPPEIKYILNLLIDFPFFNSINNKNEVIQKLEEQLEDKNKIIKDLKLELTEEYYKNLKNKESYDKKYKITEIADYLGVSRQTIYNLKNKINKGE